MIKYREKVAIPPLVMVDDLLSMNDCNHEDDLAYRVGNKTTFFPDNTCYNGPWKSFQDDDYFLCYYN